MLKKISNKIVLILSLILIGLIVWGSGVSASTPNLKQPSAPMNVEVIAKTDNSVTLKWSASTGASKISGYSIYRKEIDRGKILPFTGIYTDEPYTVNEIKLEIGKSSNTTFTDKNVKSGVMYSYTIKAYDDKKNYSAESQGIVGFAKTKLLVIASNKLYSIVPVAQSISTYLQDLTQEGWSPALVRVSNEKSTGADYICSKPIDLKNIIKEYVNKGYQGIVIIGSEPDIPTPYYRTAPDAPKVPSDMYYSDNNEWKDLDKDNAFDLYDQSGVSFANSLQPELLCGRISAGSICDDINAEADFITKYFFKLHQYRTAGSSLPDSGFVFCDTDFYNGLKFSSIKINKFVKNLDSYFDIEATNKESLKEALEKGSQLGVVMAHSTSKAFEILCRVDSNGESRLNYIPFTLDELNGIESKVHYLTLFACNACDYTTPNIGATLLFNNDYALNIFGATGNVNINTNRRHYEELALGMPIGFSTRLYMQRMTDLNEITPAMMVTLGDPTLVYKLNREDASTPIISSDLSSISVSTGSKLVLPIGAYSLGSPITDISIKGLPEGAVFDKKSATLQWTPLSTQEGKLFYLEAVVMNKNNKTCNERFSIAVVKSRKLVDWKNPGFEDVMKGVPSGWEMQSSQVLKMDSLEKIEGKYSGRIDCNSNYWAYSAYSGKILVKENTKYLVTGYVKTQNQQDNDYIRVEAITGKSENMTKLDGLSDNSFSFGDRIKCGTGWVRVSYIFSTRSGENTLRLGITTINKSGAKDIKIWLDQFEVEEM